MPRRSPQSLQGKKAARFVVQASLWPLCNRARTPKCFLDSSGHLTAPPGANASARPGSECLTDWRLCPCSPFECIDGRRKNGSCIMSTQWYRRTSLPPRSLHEIIAQHRSRELTGPESRSIRFKCPARWLSKAVFPDRAGRSFHPQIEVTQPNRKTPPAGTR